MKEQCTKIQENILKNHSKKFRSIFKKIASSLLKTPFQCLCTKFRSYRLLCLSVIMYKNWFTDVHTKLRLRCIIYEHIKNNLAKMCDYVTKIGIIIKYFIKVNYSDSTNGTFKLYFLKIFNFWKQIIKISKIWLAYVTQV